MLQVFSVHSAFTSNSHCFEIQRKPENRTRMNHRFLSILQLVCFIPYSKDHRELNVNRWPIKDPWNPMIIIRRVNLLKSNWRNICTKNINVEKLKLIAAFSFKGTVKSKLLEVDVHGTVFELNKSWFQPNLRLLTVRTSKIGLKERWKNIQFSFRFEKFCRVRHQCKTGIFNEAIWR